MPSFCAVVDCAMRGDRDNVRLFRIPALLKNAGEYSNNLSRTRQEQWIKAPKRGPLSESQIKYGPVCLRHFASGAPAELLDKDNPDWIPNQNMGYVTANPVNPTTVDRFQRFAKRKKLIADEKNDEETSKMCVPCDKAVAGPSREVSTEVSTEDINVPLFPENCLNVSTQTDLTVEILTKSFEFLNSRIYTLENKLKSLEFTEDSFKNDDTKTLYYTGVPKASMFFILFESVKKYIPCHHNKSLSLFQSLLLTFMKLRLNFPFKHLAYTFNVSPPTASRTFYECIDILHERLKRFVFWPSREALQKTMPACFSECFENKVVVIIDCFEVFMETPSKLLSAAQCWSNYKHHETVKFLIGITHQGTISFISESYGGRACDKFIAENCGILELLLPNDVVLADRGFTIKDSVEMQGASLEIPVFTKGRSQLHPVKIESTRNRMIGLLEKKYQIFKGPLLMSTLTNMVNGQSALDKIVVICSALVNMCPSTIPMN